MLTPKQTDLIRKSFLAIHDRRPELSEVFYTRLFVTEPSLREAFPQTAREQEIKLESSLQLALLTLEGPELVEPILKDLGVKNTQLGFTDVQYHVFNEILLDTLAAETGDDWTAEVSEAWGLLLHFVATKMIEGAREVTHAA